MIRQGKPLGLGHAVLAARPIIGEHDFAVLLPDVVLDPFTGDMTTDNLAFMIDAFAEAIIHKYWLIMLPMKMCINMVLLS